MPPSLFYYPSTGLNLSELSLSSILMQVLCSKMPPYILSALFFRFSFLFQFFLFFSTSHTLFSHCHLPLTCLILSFSALSLKCHAFCPLDFFFLPLCFHLSFSWVHFYLYANNVLVLRKEAAYLFTSGLNTCMHAYTCTHTQYFCACRSVHPFLSYSETSHLLILLSFVSFLHFVLLLLCSFMFSVFNYFSLIVHDLMHVHILCTPKKWYSWCIKSQREVSGC